MPTVHLVAGLLLAGVLVLTGCGASTVGAAPDPTGEWELVELWQGSTVVPAPVGGRATLGVHDGTVAGSAYCNTYGGGYRLDGDAFAVGELTHTEMACAADLMTAEAAYLAALRAVERVGSRDGYLVLTGPDVELRFRPVVPVPPAELAGTRWQLETLLDGDVASSPQAPAELVPAADGTLTGSTGCRQFRGGWTLQGDVLRTTTSGIDQVDCPADVAAQDGHVTGVLEARVRVAVVGRTLTLTAPDGLGLVYRAT